MNALFETKGRWRGVPVIDRLEIGDCWEWTGATHNKGYGRVGLDGKVVAVHRLFYEELVGPIPDGYHIDHLCLNPPCVNPDHLQAVTPKVNIGRSMKPHNMGRKTECPSGHLYDEANTRVYRGRRYCRECAK